MRRIYSLLRLFVENLGKSLFQWGQTLKYNAKARSYLNITPRKPLTSQQKKEVKDFYAHYGFGNIDTTWHRIFNGVFGQFRKEFIPPSLFYAKIEPSLNRYDYEPLQDKNMLDFVFFDFNIPRTLVKNINGFYYMNNEICSYGEALKAIVKHESFLIKPSIDSGGGRNVELVQLNNENVTQKQEIVGKLLKQYDKDFLIQDIVEQCDFMAQFNPSSLNTVRAVSYLTDSNEIVILAAILRIGAKGQKTDNTRSGGLYCEIKEDGCLGKKLLNKDLNEETVTGGGVTIDGIQIPNYEEIKNYIKKLHQRIPYFRLVSWDIARDADQKPVLIEFNINSQGIYSQVATGPLFGNYTDEILRNVGR